MRANGAAATCVPVQIDGNQWETALFVHVAGPECKQDRRLLKTATSPTPARLDTELITHTNAAIVLLRLEIMTVLTDPLAFEILLVPGHVKSHYECLKLLGQQRRLHWFFGDSDFRILQAASQEIEADRHKAFEDLARGAFAHDSILRIAGQYDADAALNEIVSHYTLREGVTRDTEDPTH